GGGPNVEVLQLRPECRRAAYPGEPTDERLAGLALGGKPADHPYGRLGNGFGRQPQGLLPELDLCLTDVATEQHLVARRRLAMGSALGAKESNVGDVMLAAGVGAAGDVDTDAANVGQASLLEGLTNRVGHTAALRHGQVARIRTRAGHDVAG